MNKPFTRKQYFSNFLRKGIDPNGNEMHYATFGGLKDSYDNYLSKEIDKLLEKAERILQTYNTKEFNGESNIYNDNINIGNNELTTDNRQGINNNTDSNIEKENNNSNNENKEYYLYITEPNACTKCLAMNGQVFETKPEPPHPNCKCQITEISQEEAKQLTEQHKKDIEQRNAAVEHLNKHVADKPGENCARRVREAAQAGLDYNNDGKDKVTIKVPPIREGNKGASAADFGPSYEKAGFEPIYKYDHNPKDIDMEKVGVKPLPKAYEPKTGDVAIFQITKAHKHGHAAMYDGKRWLSDYVQIDMWGGSIRKEAPSYVVYRNPKWNDWK